MYTDKNIKNLIDKILDHYSIMELKLHNIWSNYSYNVVSDYTYYTYNENNDAVFEELSNARFIGIKSRLSKEHIIVIMSIFQAIIDDNYWKFNIDNISDNNIDKNELLSYDNIDAWIKALIILGNNFLIDDDKPIKKPENLLRNHDGTLVTPIFEYFKQKYYTVNELNTNMKFKTITILE